MPHCRGTGANAFSIPTMYCIVAMKKFFHIPPLVRLFPPRFDDIR